MMSPAESVILRAAGMYSAVPLRRTVVGPVALTSVTAALWARSGGATAAKSSYTKSWEVCDAPNTLTPQHPNTPTPNA
jgi:hypothetical protein